MGDSYKEILIKKQPSSSDAVKKYGLIALTAVFAAAGIMITPLFLILAVAAGVACYFLFPTFDLEYEYLYVNGDIDIDKIMGKQKRKRVGSYSIEQMEILTLSDSHELDPYSSKGKVKDFTSGDPKAKSYSLVFNMDEGCSIVKLELDKDIIDDIRRRAPRKVSRDVLFS